MKIEIYDRLNFTPALPLAVYGWAEMLENGLALPEVLINWENHAIVSLMEDKPVGVIVWTKAEWKSEAYINLGYVLPAYRRRGVYASLFGALIERARDLKLNHIRGGTKISNHAMRAVAEKQGRREVGVDLYFEVPPK